MIGQSRRGVVLTGMEITQKFTGLSEVRLKLVIEESTAQQAVSNMIISQIGTMVTLFDEWTCLHCGARHLDALTHCPKCGANRTWLLG